LTQLPEAMKGLHLTLRLVHFGGRREGLANQLPAHLQSGQRGWARAQIKVVIGDGADWIWNIAAQHFPEAIPIVDLFHARQHLWELGPV